MGRLLALCISAAALVAWPAALHGEHVPARGWAGGHGPEDAGAMSPLARAVLQRDAFEQHGFMVLRRALDMETVAAARRYLDEVVWSPDPAQRPPLRLQVTSPGAYIADPNSSMMLPDSPAGVRLDTYRVECENDPGVMSPTLALTPWGRVVHDPGVRAAVEWLTGSEATPAGPVPPHIRGCLVFERGTQQGLHEDTWYALAGEGPGDMVGVWFALDDVDDGNGPLVYVPGSHRLPEVALNPAASERRWRLVPEGYGREDYRGLYKGLQHHVRELRLQERAFHARAGDVGIWHERLLHGGSPIMDMNRTRRSLVVHYVKRRLDLKESAFEALSRIEQQYGGLDRAMELADANRDSVLQLGEAKDMLRNAGMDLPDPLLDHLAMVLLSR